MVYAMEVIPYEKLLKKAQKKINSQKRGSWNGVNPITKIVVSKKSYTRKEKHRQRF